MSCTAASNQERILDDGNNGFSKTYCDLITP